MGRLRMLVVVGISGILFALTAMPGLAATPGAGPQNHVVGPSKVYLQGSHGSVQSFALSTNPKLTCYGQTDQPHYSSHVAATVNVVSRTVCPPLGVYVDILLTRDRWYGEQNLNSSANSGINSTQANAAWDCAGSGTYSYNGYGYHEASDGSYAYTYNSNRFNC